MITALIALDWGTSSLRAYRLDSGGQVLEQRQRPSGVLHLSADGPSAFEQALQDICGDWLLDASDASLIACGMVGSAQGWQPVDYLDVPVAGQALAGALVPVARGHDRPLWLVPGIRQRGALPDLARGEETQVLGLTDAHLAGPLLVGLPGSHSKWIEVRDGQIASVRTWFTGESFAALLGHTLLGRTAEGGAGQDQAAFDHGVELAASEAGERGVLGNLFAVRALHLCGELPARAQADFLSGLLIGHELRGVLGSTRIARDTPLVLIANLELGQAYRRALARFGVSGVGLEPDAAAKGLWRLARAANLIPSME